MMLDKKHVLSGRFGLEKENTRVDRNGHLSISKHPAIFKKTNPFITRDFSESQIEMVTPALPTIKETFNFMYEIEKYVTSVLADEYLWPQSNPPILPDECEIPVAEEENRRNFEYKQYLSNKYGAKRSIISGIHFNISFASEFIQDAYKQVAYEGTLEAYQQSMYLKVTKYFMKYRWLFIYLLSASPTFHNSYVSTCVSSAQVNASGDCNVEGLISLRNSVCGYRNLQHLHLDYSSLKNYEDSIESYVKNGTLRQKSELYSAIRIKHDPKNTLYLEMRILDINPLFIGGVSQQDLEMLHLFAVYFAQQPDFDLTSEEQRIAWANQDQVSILKSEKPIQTIDGQHVSILDASANILDAFSNYFSQYDSLIYDVDTIIQSIHTRIASIENTYAMQITKAIEKSNYIDFHLQQAKKFKNEMMQSSFSFRGYENLELSTQIVLQATIAKGLKFEVLDAQENFIRISDPNSNHVEYIKNATMTSKDKYSQVLVMENKKITKQVLHENDIRVPNGYEIHTLDDALELFDTHVLPNKVVIKPNTTNFGEGITIFTGTYSRDAYIEAVQVALLKDQTVLIETFLEGKEYRILVIGDKVVATLHRVAANVVGDGIHSIEALIDLKNQSYLRGEGYKTPLEKIKVTEVELTHIEHKGYSLATILPKGEVLYLRDNSNISTGGDSIDYTNRIDETYKQIALAAARALDVSICGIDMMIEDVNTPANALNYGIIEANFNPAIHIHCFPYIGKNRHVGKHVLDLLFPVI